MPDMNPDLETNICHHLRSVLNSVSIGSEIGESEEFRAFQSGLEYFIPSLLKEKYSIWKQESLDTFRFIVQHKIGYLDAELIDLCLLINDQVWTPLYFRISIYPQNNSIKYLQCKLGELDNNREILTVPYSSSKVTKLLSSIEDRLETISWAFTLKLGDCPSMHI